jgi:small conductance mechanosensitive channel
MDASLRPFLGSLIATILQVIMVLTLMQIVGLQMTIFTALIGGLGIAAGLALSGTMQNFTGGILILLLRPYRVGDNILAQAQEGTVTAIRIFYTVVTTYDNRTVIIPNSKLSNEVIINLSREGKRRVDIEFKAHYNIDFENLNRVITEVLKAERYILQEPVFRIGINNFEPDGYKVLVNAWLSAHDYIDKKMVLQEKIIKALQVNDIKLPG